MQSWDQFYSRWKQSKMELLMLAWKQNICASIVQSFVFVQETAVIVVFEKSSYEVQDIFSVKLPRTVQMILKNFPANASFYDSQSNLCLADDILNSATFYLRLDSLSGKAFCIFYTPVEPYDAIIDFPTFANLSQTDWVLKIPLHSKSITTYCSCNNGRLLEWIKSKELKP